MQRRHRVVHRWIWLVIALAAVGAVVFSVRSRPEYTVGSQVERGQ